MKREKKTDVMIHSYRRQHQNVYNTKKTCRNEMEN